MRLVLAHGCFDILHIGHIRHLKAAKALGDYLVVSVTASRFINKGAGRPVFSLEQRMEMLRELKCVDQVWASHEAGPDSAINRWKPNIYAKGSEYKGKLPEKALVESWGGKVVFTDDVVYSSTALVPMLAHV